MLPVINSSLMDSQRWLQLKRNEDDVFSSWSITYLYIYIYIKKSGKVPFNIANYSLNHFEMKWRCLPNALTVASPLIVAST